MKCPHKSINIKCNSKEDCEYRAAIGQDYTCVNDKIKEHRNWDPPQAPFQKRLKNRKRILSFISWIMLILIITALGVLLADVRDSKMRSMENLYYGLNQNKTICELANLGEGPDGYCLKNSTGNYSWNLDCTWIKIKMNASEPKLGFGDKMIMKMLRCKPNMTHINR